MDMKILVIVICMPMILTVLPATGFSIETGEIKNSNIMQVHYPVSTPGEVLILPPSTIIDIPTVREQPKKTASIVDDIVISMLEQVDETIYLSYLENLTGFGPRVTGSDACESAAEYIYNQFESMGVAVRYHHWDNGDNVEATIHGTDESSDEIYIICAHYDTEASSPGADDDGSGTVAVMMAALIMSQYHYEFNHTIKFVVFSGEEQGLLGSSAYARDATKQGWNIVGVLNADMISYAETTEAGTCLKVYHNYESEWLFNYTFDISTIYADYIQLYYLIPRYSEGSDHVSFWRQGYNALFYYESTTTPYYHTSDDTIDHINATYAVKNIRLMLATLAELSETRLLNNAPHTPSITGETNGAIQKSYNYFIQTTDPDQDDVEYLVDWGDNNNSGWIGPYSIAQIASVKHSWSSEGTYAIKVKARDEHGAESDWATLTVTMPYSYNKPMPQLLESLFQRFPNAVLILRHLMEWKSIKL